MLQKLNNKLSRNQKGFSLIELMIAIAILAFAVLGIFQAYSVGFMGMADARDRTEAVNYIQKIMEDYKNTPFDKITDKHMQPIAGTKFSSGSIVINMNEPGQNVYLKKVITQVRWTDRDGKLVIEEASTLIYRPQKTGDVLDASGIILYASPYYRILPNTSTSLTAEIHDENGNIVTDEVYEIYFEILSNPDEQLGYLNASTVITTNGKANNQYYSYEDSDGVENIKASVDLDGDGEYDASDIISIKISTGAEGIILVPETETADAGTSVNVNLYIVDASFDYELDGGSHIIPYDGDIALNVNNDIADLSTTSITASDGTAIFSVNSNGSPGLAEVTASTADLDLGYESIIFTGAAQSIKLSSSTDTIYEGGNCEITITPLDENGFPTLFTGEIEITSNSGGTFTPSSPIQFENESKKTVSFSNSVIGEDIITASSVDIEGGSNQLIINVLQSLIASYINISAIPINVAADDDDYAIVTATVYDDDDNIVSNYPYDIEFNVGGVGYFEGNKITETITPSNGIARVYLYSSQSGSSTVTADSSDEMLQLDPQGGVTINFYSTADHLAIEANPSTLYSNGNDYSTILITVYDDDDNIVADYSENITLQTDLGYFKNSEAETTLQAEDGIATGMLYSNNSGTATITASSGSLASVSTTVLFEKPLAPTLTLIEDTIANYSSGNDLYLAFDVEVKNNNIKLDKIVVSWTNSKPILQKIEIKSPSTETEYNPSIDTNSATSPHNEENINKTLYKGVSSVRLMFDHKNEKNTVLIKFYEGDTEYPIDSISYNQK
jgi:prepilin-type N-terminal cleavage/methylation domain-containing protein